MLSSRLIVALAAGLYLRSDAMQAAVMTSQRGAGAIASAPLAEGLGSSAPLTDEGLRQVASLEKKEEMNAFVHRALSKMEECKKVPDAAEQAVGKGPEEKEARDRSRADGATREQGSGGEKRTDNDPSKADGATWKQASGGKKKNDKGEKHRDGSKADAGVWKPASDDRNEADSKAPGEWGESPDRSKDEAGAQTPDTGDVDEKKGGTKTEAEMEPSKGEKDTESKTEAESEASDDEKEAAGDVQAEVAEDLDKAQKEYDETNAAEAERTESELKKGKDKEKVKSVRHKEVHHGNSARVSIGVVPLVFAFFSFAMTLPFSA